jgi:hypothetical protein
MKRREFITLLGGAAAIWPACLRAEPASKVPRIGFIVTGSLWSPEQRTMTDAFRQGLRERGYVEGQNIVIEYRAADGKIERFTELAMELVDLHPDLIVASNTPAARAAKQATTTMPIVVAVMGDPVGDGLVALRLGVADFGVAQLMHDDESRVLSVSVFRLGLRSAVVRFPHGHEQPMYQVRCTRPSQCTHDVPGEAGWARMDANRAGRKYRPKCLILRGLWSPCGHARTEKNGGERRAGARGRN